tara:strand:- start:83 stop:514 length:432 start_codon:yes stop_codon:yes gene_type:complete
MEEYKFIKSKGERSKMKIKDNKSLIKQLVDFLIPEGFKAEPMIIYNFLSFHDIGDMIDEVQTYGSGGNFFHVFLSDVNGIIYHFSNADGWIEKSYYKWPTIDDYIESLEWDNKPGFGREMDNKNYKARRWDYKQFDFQQIKEV